MLTCGCFSSYAHMCKQNVFLAFVHVAYCFFKEKIGPVENYEV